MSGPVAIQSFDELDQVLVIASIAQDRSDESKFMPADVEPLFDDAAVPVPGRISNKLRSLANRGLVVNLAVSPGWRLTPRGRDRVQELLADVTGPLLPTLESVGSNFGGVPHSVIGPQFAPGHLVGPVGRFCTEFPFERNVFGMTRFPGEIPEQGNEELRSSIELARSVCATHGFEFHLASDRQIVDDVWGNVSAHMWGCSLGIAFFETRSDRGLIPNLCIEVGASLMTGRRIALLKDALMDEPMPSDLVGQIYKPVDLTDPKTVEDQLNAWFANDLSLG